MGKKKHTKAETVETRSYVLSDPAIADWLGLSNTTLAGVYVNEASSLGLASVYRAVSIISSVVAGLPLKSYRTLSDGSRERVITFVENPHPEMTSFEWVELVLVHLLLQGNAFLLHLYNGAGAIIGLQPIHPRLVTVNPIVTDTDRAKYGEYLKYFTVSLADGTSVNLTVGDLTHIPALGTDGLRGVAPITAHRQAIATGIAGDQAAARMFGNGMLIGGIVTSDESLSEADAIAAKAGLQAKMQGSKNAGDLAFVNAALKFTPWTMSAQDAQFIESRVHQVEEVSRIFGVPPHLLGQTEKQTSWGTGVAEQNRGLARYTLMAWTSRIEQRLSRLLTRPTICEFDYAGLLQPAPEVGIPLLISQVEAGLLTLDEARRYLNLAPLPAKPATNGAGVVDAQSLLN